MFLLSHHKLQCRTIHWTQCRTIHWTTVHRILFEWDGITAIWSTLNLQGSWNTHSDAAVPDDLKIALFGVLTKGLHVVAKERTDFL